MKSPSLMRTQIMRGGISSSSFLVYAKCFSLRTHGMRAEFADNTLNMFRFNSYICILIYFSKSKVTSDSFTVWANSLLPRE